MGDLQKRLRCLRTVHRLNVGPNALNIKLFGIHAGLVRLLRAPMLRGEETGEWGKWAKWDFLSCAKSRNRKKPEKKCQAVQHKKNMA